MNNTFGENLKRIRIEKGITQKQLANMIMTSPSNISKWENGELYPQIIWVYVIAKILEVKPADLVNVSKYESQKR